MQVPDLSEIVLNPDAWINVPDELFPEISRAQLLHLELMANNLSALKAADECGISLRTAEAHRLRLAKLLAIKGNAGALRLVLARMAAAATAPPPHPEETNALLAHMIDIE